MENVDFNPTQLIEAITKRNVPEVRKIFEDYNLIDIAEVLNTIENPADLLFIFKTVPANYTGEVFTYLDKDVQENLINTLTSEQISAILDNVYTDDIVDFIEEMPSNLMMKILRSASKQTRQEINHLLDYKENSAGSIMTTELIELKEEDTIKEAMDRIRKTGKEAETISYLFVIDNSRKLVGTLRLRDLIFAAENSKIGDIMETDFVSVMTTDDQEVVASIFKRYDLNAIPVTTQDSRLVGIITVDDIIDVIDEEATEDIQKMAAMQPLQEEYLKIPVFTLAKKRIVWLMVLMFSATFTGLIINRFEDVLMHLPALTIFIPMLMDTGGNSGGQTSTLVIRGLALGQITTKDYGKVLTKEMGVALIAGGSLAAFDFCWILFENAVGIIKITPTVSPYLVALLVALSLFITIFLAKSIGSTLPIIAKKIGFDPALMAGPLVTTIVDAVSLMVYFFLATQIFRLI